MARETLHEHLLRDAGFEVAGDLERQRRREERRRSARSRAYRFLRCVSVVGGAIAFVDWVAGIVVFATTGLDSHATHLVLGAALAVATVALPADALLRWTPLGGDAAERSRRRRRRGFATWIFGRDVVEIAAWIRDRRLARREGVG